MSGSIPMTSRVNTFSSSPGAVCTTRRRSETAAAAETSGMARNAWTVRGVKPVSANARSRTSAAPSRSAVALRNAASEAALVTMVAATTATPSATPITASAVRRGRASSPRHAIVARRIGA